MTLYLTHQTIKDMESTHVKGLLGELAFIQEFIKRGYNVLQPINPNSSYDLVIEKSGLFTRLQVKYATPRNNLIRVELSRPKRNTRKYPQRGVDAMAIYDSKNRKYYLIPIEKVGMRFNFWLRLNQPKNNQKKNIHFINDFIL